MPRLSAVRGRVVALFVVSPIEESAVENSGFNRRRSTEAVVSGCFVFFTFCLGFAAPAWLAGFDPDPDGDSLVDAGDELFQNTGR